MATVIHHLQDFLARPTKLLYTKECEHCHCGQYNVPKRPVTLKCIPGIYKFHKYEEASI